MTIWISAAPTKIAVDVMLESLLRIQRGAEERVNVLPIPYSAATQGIRKDQKTYLNVKVDLKDHRDRTFWDETCCTQPRYLVGLEGVFVGSNYINHEAQGEEGNVQEQYPHGDGGEREDDGTEDDMEGDIDDIITAEVVITTNKPSGNDKGQSRNPQKKSVEKPAKGWPAAYRAIESKITREEMMSSQSISTSPQTRYRRLANGSIVRISGNNSTLLQSNQTVGKETGNPRKNAVDESQLDLEGGSEEVKTTNDQIKNTEHVNAVLSDNSFTTVASDGAFKDVLSISELDALENNGAAIKTFKKPDGEVSDRGEAGYDNKENEKTGKPLTRSQRKISNSMIADNQSSHPERSPRISTPRRYNNSNNANLSQYNNQAKTPTFSPNDITERDTPRNALTLMHSNRVRSFLTTEALVNNYTAEQLTAFVEAGNQLCASKTRTQRSPPETVEAQEKKNDASRNSSFRERAKIGPKGLSKRSRQVPQNKRQKKAEGKDMV